MVLDVPLWQAASPVCHPPLQRRTILFTAATERGLSQALRYFRCYSWSGCRAEPRLALGRILIVSGSVTPDGFPWWQWCRVAWAPFLLHSCPGQCRRLDPALPPSTSVALATSLEAQVSRTNSQSALGCVLPSSPRTL